MFPRFPCLVLVAVAGLTVVPRDQAGEQPVPELRTGNVPIGCLGHPLGRYLSIEGVRGEGNKSGVSTLMVETVNGQKLREPVPLWIENVALPGSQRCVLKGYETCRMIGQPPALEEAARESGKDITMPQAGWQMQMFFVATSVVSPDQLRIRSGRGGRIP